MDQRRRPGGARLPKGVIRSRAWRSGRAARGLRACPVAGALARAEDEAAGAGLEVVPDPAVGGVVEALVELIAALGRCRRVRLRGQAAVAEVLAQRAGGACRRAGAAVVRDVGRARCGRGRLREEGLHHGAAQGGVVVDRELGGDAGQRRRREAGEQRVIVDVEVAAARVHRQGQAREGRVGADDDACRLE